MSRNLTQPRNVGRWLAIAASVSALTLTACSTTSPAAPTAKEGQSSSWEATVAAAEAGGTLTVYSVVPAEQTEALANAFREEYPGIDINVQRMGTEIYAKLDQEVQNNLEGAEVVLMANDAFIHDNSDAFMDITADVPSAQDWPEWVADAYAPTIGLTVGYIGWNTDVVRDGLKDWKDLLDPDFKGKIGTRDTMSATWAFMLDFWEDTQGPDFLPAIAAQEPRFYPGAGPLTQAVAANEVPVQMVGALGTLLTLQAQGAPIDYVIPKKTWGLTWTALGLKNARNPEAAKVFLEFILSKEGQTTFNGNTMGGISPVPIDGGLDVTDYDITVMDPSEYGPDVIKKWDVRFRDIFNL
jgi:iron(III) transport system substrate-binding protein